MKSRNGPLPFLPTPPSSTRTTPKKQRGSMISALSYLGGYHQACIYLAPRGTSATGSSKCIGLCQTPRSGPKVDPGYVGPKIYTSERIYL